MDLTDQHNVSRFAPYKKLERDENDKPVRLLPQAFELRLNEEKLSVNWLEYFGLSHSKNVEKVVQDFRKSRAGKPGPNSGFGIGNVGILHEICTSQKYNKVKVVHDGKAKNGNPTHASIIRLPINDGDLMLLMASEVFTQLVMNSDIPDI